MWGREGGNVTDFAVKMKIKMKERERSGNYFDLEKYFFQNLGT